MSSVGTIDRGLIMLAAGGTGGHLFPAQALAEVLRGRGWRTQLMTDERVRDYGKNFPADKVHVVPSATLTPGQPLRLPGQLLRLASGYRRARAILAAEKAAVVAGFGGYPSFPPILAAAALKIPSLVHEQNAVMGRANRALARFAGKVASSFPEVRGLSPRARSKLIFTGNPVRALALAERAAPYPALSASEPFRVLVFGGSQGARFFSEFMPEVVKELAPAVVKTLVLTQQVRPEDHEKLSLYYQALNVKAELQPFFMDMPQHIAMSHLVVCRSGASTIAELGVIGRPAIMVPLPGSLDSDQLYNARSFAAAGAGWVRPQAELTPSDFAAFLTHLRYEEGSLKRAAQAALGHGRPDAAERLADVAEALALQQLSKKTD